MLVLDRTGVFAPASLPEIDTALRQNLTLSQCPWFGDLCQALPVPLLIVNTSGNAVLINDRFLDLVEAMPGADILGARTDTGAMERLCLESRPLRALGEDYVLLTPIPGAGNAADHQRALERVFFNDLLNTAGGVQGLSEIMGEAEVDEMPALQATVRDLADQLVDEITAQRDLLAAEAGDLTVEARSVDARDQLRLVAARYRDHPVAGDRELVVVPGRGPGVLTTDPVLLGRVLGNLVKNALEAVPDGGVVTLDCGHRGGQVWFTVQNPGYLPPMVRDRVFQRAFSTKGQGRGMGTFSVKLLVEDYLAGSVRLSSDTTRGTTFTVSLPCAGP